MRITLRHSDSRRIDLVLVLCCLSIFGGTSLSAQVPVIKGHSVGETIQQFLTVSPALSARLGLCRNLKTPKEARKQEIDWGFCQRLIAGVDSKGEVEVVDDCAMKVSTWRSQPACLEFHGLASFSDGRLALLSLHLVDPWANVYEDLAKQFGPPLKTWESTFQNGYGATYTGSNAAWDSPLYGLMALEKVQNLNYPLSGCCARSFVPVSLLV